MNQNNQQMENGGNRNSDDLYSQLETRHNRWPKIIGLVLIVALLLVIGYYGYKRSQREKSLTNNSVTDVPAIEKPDTTPTSETDTNIAKEPTTIPASGLLTVPFTTQAPFANWDAIHEEACEEASLIMLYHYQNDTLIESTTSADKEILDLVSWETENGYGHDVTLEQLSDIAKKYYNMNSGRIITDVTIDNIKKEISAGRPVIVPAAGKILPNPNFRNGGPNYHMLVIIGYDEEDFITNDPGTRNGKNFRYSYDGLLNAIHNWNSSNILDGQKELLVFD